MWLNGELYLMLAKVNNIRVFELYIQRCGDWEEHKGLHFPCVEASTTLPTSFSFLLILRMNKFKYIPRTSYTLQNLTPLCFGFQLPCCSLYGSSANEIICFSKFSQYKVFQKPVRTRGERQCSKWLRRSSATQHMPTSQRAHFLSSSPCISSPWAWVV